MQARMILFEWTRGFNQWTSAYLYGTDILLATLFVFWLAKSLKRAPNPKSEIRLPRRDESRLGNPKKNSKFKILNSKFFLGLFLLVAALSIFNAQIKGLAWYQLLKLAEFIGFYFYLVRNRPAKGVATIASGRSISNEVYLKHNLDRVFQFRSVLAVVIASGLFQALIGIIQYAKQGSVGLYILGESPLSVHASGVAVFVADGVKHIRAYGLTPHPNVLAAWLFTAIFALYFIYLYPHTHRGVGVYSRTNLESSQGSKWLLLVYVMLLLGLLFTFSRVIVGLWVLGTLARILIVFFKRGFRENPAIRQGVTRLSIVSLVVVIAFSALFWPQVKSRLVISPTEEAVAQRVFYNKEAVKIVEGSPWLGVGIGQFVPEMMEKFKRLPAQAYQPVHNIYLLIASETGFVGLSVFLIFLFSVFWRFIKGADFGKLHNFSFFIFVFSFLLIGLFDHFLWTSQQGSFIFWMALALLNVSSD